MNPEGKVDIYDARQDTLAKYILQSQQDESRRKGSYIYDAQTRHIGKIYTSIRAR